MSRDLRDAGARDRPSSPEWASRDGATLRAFDDGHVPENLRAGARGAAAGGGDSGGESTLVEYALHRRRDGAGDARAVDAVDVYEDAMEGGDLVDALYAKTARSGTWGDYVTLDRVRDFWETGDDGARRRSSAADDEGVVLAATSRFLALALGEGGRGPTTRHAPGDGGSRSDPLFAREDLDLAHGVAVWGLAARTGVSPPR